MVAVHQIRKPLNQKIIANMTESEAASGEMNWS